jgi:hypothetical protein
LVRSKQFQLPLGGRLFPLSIDNAHVIIVRAIERGDVAVPDSFKSCCTIFSTVDVERVIKTGAIVSDPEHVVDDMWFFRIIGDYETREMEIRIALDLAEDLDFPLVVYIDAQCRRTQ